MGWPGCGCPFGVPGKPPGRGVVKFVPYLQAIKELKIDGVVSIELEYAPDPSKIVEWVEEAYHETAKLMDIVGLRNGNE